MAHELLVFKAVERETVAFFHLVVVVLNVGNDAFAHLQHDVVGGRCALLVLVHALKVLLHHRAVWNDEGGEVERQGRDEYT